MNFFFDSLLVSYVLTYFNLLEEKDLSHFQQYNYSFYAAHLHSGEKVAVKVQRPGMSLTLTLDALLFHMIGGQLKRFAKAQKDLFVAVNEVVSLFFPPSS